ncbi:hypothetical protein [Nocardia abscessus]|uniref:hypothetical protein n=1 Tax=Nocardia abscessus TaxID=120957 RepID=UPI0012F8DB15|nr:hypothetical protein [Nocardia abscessus]
MNKPDPRDAGLGALAAAAVGVLAWRSAATIGACAVTPLQAPDGRPVVTSTLAMIGKMRRIAADPHVALAAGGIFLQATALLQIDRDGTGSARALLAQEAEKFAPTRHLSAIPGHRRWLPWYFGRVIATLTPTLVIDDAGSDGTVLVTLRQDKPWITSLPARTDLFDARPGDRLHLPEIDAADGPAILLAHQENQAMTALAQRRISGRLRGGVLQVERRSGSLNPTAPGLLTQLRELRALRRKAAASTVELDHLTEAIAQRWTADRINPTH